MVNNLDHPLGIADVEDLTTNRKLIRCRRIYRNNVRCKRTFKRFYDFVRHVEIHHEKRKNSESEPPQSP